MQALQTLQWSACTTLVGATCISPPSALRLVHCSAALKDPIRLLSDNEMQFELELSPEGNGGEQKYSNSIEHANGLCNRAVLQHS